MKEKLVTVARYNDYLEADLARQMLEDEGITGFVLGQNTGVAWPVPPAGGIELQVPQSRAEEAREILEAAREQVPEENQSPEEDEDWDDEEEAEGSDEEQE